MPQFGRWCLLEFFGVYGQREIIGALKTWRGPRRTFYPHVSYFVSSDYSLCPCCRLALMISLFAFPFLVR